VSRAVRLCMAVSALATYRAGRPRGTIVAPDIVGVRVMFDPTTLLGLHTWLSLIGLASGFVVLIGLLQARRLEGWTAVFLTTTVLTSLTGFGPPADRLLPSHIVGAISLVLLAVAILALYVYRLAGSWRWIYVVTAMAALYLNAFVGVVQAFRQIPALHALAPTESEPPFAIAQGIVLVVFVILTIWAVRAFRPTVLESTRRMSAA